jgi:hypothetical protein
MLSVALLSIVVLYLTIYLTLRMHNKSAKNWDVLELNQFNCPSPSLPVVGNCYVFAGHPTRK